MRRHIISVLVEDKPGVMQRISGLFARRGFNIDTIAVGRSEVKGLSRIILTVSGDEKVLEQVRKQLEKQVDVIKVRDLDPERSVVRELCLVKVAINSQTRSDIVELSSIFRGRIVDVSHDSLTIEITGDTDKVEAFLHLLEPYGIKEVARTGIVAMSRG